MCAVGDKPISDGYAKTGAYFGENRKVGAVFCVKFFQELSETNASVPTVQLQSIRAVLAVIAYRKWDFRAVGVSGAFLRSGHLKRDAYATLPDGVEKDNISWELLNPLYGMSTACKDWCEIVRDCISEDWRWGWGGGLLP